MDTYKVIVYRYYYSERLNEREIIGEYYTKAVSKKKAVNNIIFRGGFFNHYYTNFEIHYTFNVTIVPPNKSIKEK